MSNNDFNENEIKFRQERERKVKEFRLHIDEEDLNRPYHLQNQNPTPNNLKAGENKSSERKEINSFSGGKTKAQLEKNMKKADKLQQKEAKKREKRKSKKNKRIFLLIWLTMIIMAGIILSGYILTGINDMLAISRPDSKEVTVKIGKDDSFDKIIDTLYVNGVIKEKKFFKFYANMKHAEDLLERGTFQLKTNMDYEEIINYLESPYNNEKSVSVQITEGMSVVEIAKKLEKAGVTADKQAFLDMCNSDEFDEDYDFIKALGKASDNGRYYKLEGYLYPDTYTFYENEDPSLTVSRMLSNFAAKNVNTLSAAEGYDKKVSVEDRALDTGYTFDQIMTIASLIQAEAANTKDMYNVSSILHNRLNAGNASEYAKLGLDSTVYYPYRNAKSVPSSLGGRKFISTYNTYDIVGLPAGPVCNPSSEAIEAAINPNNTSYYYFCHDSSTGEAYYASSYDEHLYNLSLIGD
ncbi:MAG: endolytic transglycosylase MltG [Oscillospiraceae bacterium]|nr:endolytic transglycosylase MltG [Oscillospiraceae bacterium]